MKKLKHKRNKESKENKFKITPTGDRVLIRPYKGETEKTVGKITIVLPDSVSEEKSDKGVVLSVGDGKYIDGKLIPVRVRVGDKIIFSKYGYDEVNIDGEELYLVKEDNILAIIK